MDAEKRQETVDRIEKDQEYQRPYRAVSKPQWARRNGQVESRGSSRLPEPLGDTLLPSPGVAEVDDAAEQLICGEKTVDEVLEDFKRYNTTDAEGRKALQRIGLEFELEDRTDAQIEKTELKARIAELERDSQSAERFMNRVSKLLGCTYKVTMSNFGAGEDAILYQMMKMYKGNAKGAHDVAEILQDQVTQEFKTRQNEKLKSKDIQATEPNVQLPQTKTAVQEKDGVLEAKIKCMEEKVDCLEDKIQRLEIGAAAGGDMASRILTNGKHYPGYNPDIKGLGSNAVYDADMLRDAALYSTGHITMDKKWWFKLAYLTDVDQYIGGFNELRPLLSGARTSIRTHCATMHAALIHNSLEPETALRDPILNEFQDLIKEFRTIEDQVALECQDLDKIQEEEKFEGHPRSKPIAAKMKELIVLYRQRK